MGHHQDRRALVIRQAPEQLHRRTARIPTECGSGFIGEQEARAWCLGTRNRHLHLLQSGEIGQQAVGQRDETRLATQLRQRSGLGLQHLCRP